MAPGRADLSHRTEQPVPGEGVPEHVRAELPAAVGVQHAPRHHARASSPRDGLVKGVHGQRGLHAPGHGVPHDPPGVEVLDGAEVELALARGVLGDVGQPELVQSLGGELALDTVIAHGRAGPAPVLAWLGPER